MKLIEEKEDYYLFKLVDMKYNILVVETSSESPIKLINMISDDLIKNKIEGKIIIDSLLYNGGNKERFISAIFINGKFDIDSFEFVKIERGDPIRKITSEYLRQNKELIEYSILNTIQKRLILSGCNL